MDNIKKLQRQARRPLLVCVILMDVSLAVLAVLLSVTYSWDTGFYSWDKIVNHIWDVIKETREISGVLPIGIIFCHIWAIRSLLVMHPSVRNLPPEIRAAINEQCMTGMNYGNGILCEDGYLLTTDRELKVAGPGELARIDERKALFGRAKYLSVMTRQYKRLDISISLHRVRGNGTFQTVDVDTFRRELDKFISGDGGRSDETGKPSEVLFRGTNVEIPRTVFQGTNVETLLEDSEEERNATGKIQKNS